MSSPRLYSQAEPGWKCSGSSASASMNSAPVIVAATCPSRPDTPCGAASCPGSVAEAGGVAHQVLDRRLRAQPRDHHLAAAGVTADFTTRMFASAGRYLPTGSFTISRPSSQSMSAATVTIGLVIDAMLKIASFGIGVRLALSRYPNAS